MDSCAISVYKLSRNEGKLFIFFRLLAGQNVVSYSIHRSCLCFAQLCRAKGGRRIGQLNDCLNFVASWPAKT